LRGVENVDVKVRCMVYLSMDIGHSVTNQSKDHLIATSQDLNV